ncbi:MAG: signal recognition particle receptor subunit alpha, partial [Castellaniella sp.]
MLDNLTSRLSRVVKTMRGEARLTEANTQEMLREVRMALLEADVALPVVRDFVARVKESALGQEVAGSLNPGQALVGVVHKELTALMGGDLGAEAGELSLATQPPAVILMAGLQGAGKTTTTGKLAKWLSEGNHVQHGRKTGRKKVLVVSTDVYRPAAIDQLKTVAAQVGVDFLPTEPTQKPQDIARDALDHARRHHYDVLIVDTAGRLGIDQAMMDEIRALHQLLSP